MVRDLLTGLNGPSLDLTLSGMSAMLAALVSAGVVLSAEAAALQALQQIKVSRISQVAGWVGPVGANDIIAVRGS